MCPGLGEVCPWRASGTYRRLVSAGGWPAEALMTELVQLNAIWHGSVAEWTALAIRAAE